MKILQTITETTGAHIDPGEALIVCPICQDENTHFEYEVKISRNEDSLMGHRGGGLTIPMKCESGGHTWDLVISFHKGNSYITTTNFKQAIHG